jgi:hypothetical protein
MGQFSRWFDGLNGQAQGAIIGVLIGSVFTIVIAILTILFKDYLIPILTEKRTQSNLKLRTFKEYSNPLIQAVLSYLFRINEIIYGSSQFLLSSTPKNEYNKYKYISTVYRLCVVLGWIRAMRIELSHVEVRNTKEFKKVESALDSFEQSLADGGHVEVSRAQHLCAMWNLNWDSLVKNKKRELGSAIELLFDSHCYKGNCDLPIDLTPEKQLELCIEVFDLICTMTKTKVLPKLVIKNQLERAIREMSRTEVWIYRDWQSSIGNLMIKRNLAVGERKYEVMSYPEFEEAFNNPGSLLNKWIFRVQGLFENLNTKVEDRFDARTNQIKNNYIKAKELIQSFSEVSKSEVNLVEHKIEELQANEKS